MKNAVHVDKVRKLLALAESSNEEEAKLALLRAQEIIAKYKIAESELGEPVSAQDVVTIPLGFSYTSSTAWRGNLAKVLAEHMGCFMCVVCERGRRTYHTSVVGLEKDAGVAAEAIRFAVAHVDVRIDAIKKILARECPGPEWRRYRADVCLSYGHGFVSGVDSALREQEENSEWGLVLQMPEPVRSKKEREFRTVSVANSKRYTQLDRAFNDGFEQGASYEAFEKPQALPW